MLRHPTIPLAPEDKAVCVKWLCGMLSIWAVIVVATFTLPIFRGESASISRLEARGHAAGKLEFPSGSVNHFTNDPVVKRY